MCAICTQLWSAGTPPSAHLSGELRASHPPSGGLLRQGECPAERHDFPFLLLLSKHAWAPYSVAVVGLILQATGFYLTCAREDLQPHTSKQVKGQGWHWHGCWVPVAEQGSCFQQLHMQHLTPKQRGARVGTIPCSCKHGTIPCSSPACLRGRISFSASGKASQLLKSLICDDKEGTED